MRPTFLLLLALAGLAVGPILASLWPRAHAWRDALDGLALALVTGLTVVHLLPHAVAHGGPAAVGAGVLGLFAPWLVGRLPGAGWLALVLLVLHAALDGAALALTHHHGVGASLGLAVIAHRLPVGLVTWQEGTAHGGPMRGWLALAGLVAATVLGYALGAPLASVASEGVRAAFEALVAGALLHIVFDHHHGAPAEACEHDHDHAALLGPSTAAHGHDHEHSPHGHAHAHDHDHHAHAHEHDHDHHGHAHEPSHAPPHHGQAHDHAPQGHEPGHDHDTSAPAAPVAPPSDAPLAAPEGGEAGTTAIPGHHFHHPHTTAWAAVGALVGALAVATFTLAAGATGPLQHTEAMATTFAGLALESAPALLAGYLLAGLAAGLLPDGGARWLGRGGSLSQALRGVTVGLPLPVCSCGVLPLYAGLVRRGVPAAAGLAFLVATPELGLDAVLLSVPLLGLPLAITRVVAAFAIAVAVGVLVGRAVPSAGAPPDEAGDVTASTAPLAERLGRGLRYGLVDLVDHTLPWVVVGLAVAALAEPLLGHDLLQQLPPVLQVPLFATLGIPIYVCATGATPLAAVAVHKGVSAGAALAFLLAGPATNLTTFGLLAELHDRRTALRFGLAVVILAVLTGWTVDLLGLAAPEVVPHTPHTGPGPLSQLALLALALLALASLLRQGPRGVLGQIVAPVHVH